MVHRRTHTGDKPYECAECPLRFTSSGNLKTHAKLHAGAREYQCHLCDKAYPRADTLKRHILRSGFTCTLPQKCMLFVLAFSL